jgi:hypothetical protein
MKTKSMKLLTLAAIIAGSSAFVFAQQYVEDDGEHSSHSHADTSLSGSKLPSEPGQGAFAAMTEIAGMMRADKTTDWTTADLRALRDHLVDMDRLMTTSQVREETSADGLTIKIDLANAANDAAVRMVPAHAPILAAETGWQSTVETDGTSLTWTVQSNEDAAQIKALGFYGLMAVGDHHRPHHWAMAKGVNTH